MHFPVDSRSFMVKYSRVIQGSLWVIEVQYCASIFNTPLGRGVVQCKRCRLEPAEETSRSLCCDLRSYQLPGNKLSAKDEGPPTGQLHAGDGVDRWTLRRPTGALMPALPPPPCPQWQRPSHPPARLLYCLVNVFTQFLKHSGVNWSLYKHI